MTRHYPDLVITSDWLKQIFHAARPIRSTTQIWVVTGHQYGISAVVSRRHFAGKQEVASRNFRLFALGYVQYSIDSISVVQLPLLSS